jgi:hypothetical protein
MNFSQVFVAIVILAAFIIAGIFFRVKKFVGYRLAVDSIAWK